MIHRAGVGILCALGSAALYGLVPNFVRAAFVHGVPPVESILMRTSAIAVVFAIVTVLNGVSFSLPRLATGSLIAQSVSILAVSFGYLASVQFIPVGLAVIIFFSFPVLIMLGAPVIEAQNPGLPRILIAVFAFTGLAVAIGPSFEALDFRGILLAFVGAIGAALQFFSGRSVSRYLTPSVFGSVVHAGIWPLVLGAALVAGGGKLTSLPGGEASGTGLAFMFALAAVYVAAYMVQMLSLRFAPASTVAPFYNLEPVVTTGVAALVLGERLQINQYAGGGMVLAALLASSLIGTQKTSPA